MDDYCNLNKPQPNGIPVCPTCGSKGKPVPKFTVPMIVKDPKVYLHPERLPDAKYFICETRSCPTVYFSADGVTFGKEQMRVKVWQKEDDPDVPVCYCFHHTISSITRELEETGDTGVIFRISAEVKAGNCRCEVTNPQGSCCLGNVAKAIKIAKEHLTTREADKHRKIAPLVSNSDLGESCCHVESDPLVGH